MGHGTSHVNGIGIALEGKMLPFPGKIGSGIYNFACAAIDKDGKFDKLATIENAWNSR